jgi:HEAT repeat protein
LGNFASSDMAKFEIFFRRMRQAFPAEVTEACLCYIAAHGLDTAAHQMTQWLTGRSRYLEVLFDPTLLSAEAATKAAGVLKEVDEYFFAKFFRVASEVDTPQKALRVLSLLPVLGDSPVLLPLLRSLGRYSDEGVRSKAVELLCELRSNKIPIERQMASDEPRVRARALEFLWYVRNKETSGIFRKALSDSHHRVIANALVGLHLQHDSSAFPKMVELAAHTDPLMRSAMAWSFGYILDKRAVPMLEVLSKDSSTMVRTRALRSLAAIQTEGGSGTSFEPAACEASPPVARA